LPTMKKKPNEKRKRKGLSLFAAEAFMRSINNSFGSDYRKLWTIIWLSKNLVAL